MARQSVASERCDVNAVEKNKRTALPRSERTYDVAVLLNGADVNAVNKEK